MLESLDFTFDGISCKDMGIVSVQEGGGTFKENVISRTVNTTRIPYRDKSILQRVEKQPLSFTLNLYLNEWQARNNLRAILRWLDTDYYKPLIFESNTDQVFYAIVDGTTSLTHNGLQQGGLQVNFVCNSPYSYSSLKKDIIEVNGTEERMYYNEGDASIRPQLKIIKIGDGDISITNSANQQVMRFTGLLNNEEITINGENEEIVSSLESSSRYILENHNDVWLDFDYNHFTDTKFIFEGNFYCEFYFEYKYLQQDRPIYFE